MQALKDMIEFLNADSTHETDSYIDKEYSYIMQISSIYLKMDRPHLPFSCVQFVICLAICLCHWCLVLKGLFLSLSASFVLWTKCAYFFLLIQVAWIVVVIAQTKHRELARIHRRLSEGFFDYEEPNKDTVERLRKEMYAQRRIMVLIPLGASMGAVGLFVMAPICDRLGTFKFTTNATSFINYDLPIALTAYPFSTREPLGFYVAFVGQLLSGVILPLVIGGGGYLIIVVSGNLTFQLKILLHSLENIEQRAAYHYSIIYGKPLTLKGRAMYSDREYDFCFYECLKKCFRHHQIIISCFGDIAETFSAPLFLAYLTGTVVIALGLLSSNFKELPGTTVTSGLLCVVEVGYMGFISILGQNIIDLSSELRVKMYDIKWYQASTRVRSSVLIFQVMTLKPLTILSGGIIPVNLETFAKVMNSAYTYYNLVNAFQAA